MRWGCYIQRSFTLFDRLGRELLLQPRLLRRGSQEGSYSDSNHTQQQEKGFTQRGVKPNWLCFIARPARGKWRSDKCVCRCYRVLSREALFHNGWDKIIAYGGIGKIVFKALQWNSVGEVMDFLALTGWAQLTVIFVTSQLVSIYCTLDLQTEDKPPCWKRAGWIL